jgi:dimethylhistidine N-methyltransferase
MVNAISPNGVLVEFGSGSSMKTEILFGHLSAETAYVPVDVSSSALANAKQRLAKRFPALEVYPVVGSFAQPVEIPAHLAARPRAGFFPGSTIGNLMPQDAIGLLGVFRGVLSAGGRLIIGVDLKKDARKLVEAYNDRAGVTAAFNLNLLVRINRELGCALDLSSFRHEAIYEPIEGRIEMHLVSKRDQYVTICGQRFRFRAGESIHTENSYKYSIAQFQELARQAGWTPARVWTDPNRQFSVHELAAP